MEIFPLAHIEPGTRADPRGSSPSTVAATQLRKALWRASQRVSDVMQQCVPAGMPYTPQQGALSVGATTPHGPGHAEPSKRSSCPRKPHINQNAANQSHPLPSSHGGDQAGLQHHPRGDGAEQGDISCPLLGLVREQHQNLLLGQGNHSHPHHPWGSSASLRPTFPGESWASWGSQEAAGPRWSQHPRHPSSLSAPLAARRALASGAARRETGRRQRGDKPRHKQKQLARPETSKHPAEIYVAAEPVPVLGRWGQPPGPGGNAGRMCCCGSCMQSHGLDKLCGCNRDAGKG